MSLPSSMADFVPRDRWLQKAYWKLKYKKKTNRANLNPRKWFTCEKLYYTKTLQKKTCSTKHGSTKKSLNAKNHDTVFNERKQGYLCNVSLFQIDKPPNLHNLSTIVHFHLGQTPANLTATSSPSEGRI